VRGGLCRMGIENLGAGRCTLLVKRRMVMHFEEPGRRVEGPVSCYMMCGRMWCLAGFAGGGQLCSMCSDGLVSGVTK